MRNLTFIFFRLLLIVILATVAFSSCKDEEDELKVEDPTAIVPTVPTNNIIAVSGIVLDKTNVSLAAGKDTTLIATVTPSDASDKTITWTSSDTTKAKVTNGKVTAVAVGTAIITAKGGDKTVICSIAITPNIISTIGITLDKTSLNYLVGETPITATTLVASVAPENATDKTVIWTSSNTSIANVNSTGVLTVNTTSAGPATITAQAGDKTATCIITVSVLQTSGFVTINGIKWATCNIDAPGSFASEPAASGMYYQWNSKVGWNYPQQIPSDGISTWDILWNGGLSTVSTVDTWDTSNDPSPSGYRIPTIEEIRTLVDTAKVAHAWTSLNGVYGEKFTDKKNGNIIFLPATGYISNTSGVPGIPGLNNKGNTDGKYWCSTATLGYNTSKSDYLGFNSSNLFGSKYDRATGLNIRPIVP